MEEEILIEKAREAMAYAYAPYSGYHVGAAVQDEEGNVYTGCNIENASYGASMCAERTAVFCAVSKGAKKIKKIAVAADGGMPYPCGMCRQVMTEFMEESAMLIVESNGNAERYTLQELMPHTFKLDKQ